MIFFTFVLISFNVVFLIFVFEKKSSLIFCFRFTKSLKTC